jgi:hypothetical protein
VPPDAGLFTNLGFETPAEHRSISDQMRQHA